MNPNQWRQISLSLIYAIANYDDVVNAFIDGEHEGQLGTEKELQDLLELVKDEINKAHKLARVYYELYPKEVPNIYSDELWDSIDCTFSNWINRLIENPASSLSTGSDWNGKVTKAYFKMIDHPCPRYKNEMIDFIKTYLRDQP